MPIELRPPQERSIDECREEMLRQLRAHQPVSLILQSPTGSGKTVMAGYMAARNVAKGGTVAFLCHRRELVEQTALTFERLGLDFGFIASGFDQRPAPIQICSVPTLHRRLEHIPAPPSLVIWDECHHVGATTWKSIRSAWRESVHVGLTATPCRLDGKGLGSWFRTLVLGPSVRDLMADGYLSTYDAYAPTSPDRSHFHVRNGDFIASEMQAELEANEIVGNVVGHWRRLAGGRRTIGFAVSVHHSILMAEAFDRQGIPAAHLDAKSGREERRETLRAFARGDIQVLWNVDLFGEGYDLAANSGMDVTVDAVIQARPTASLGLHLQQVGRCLRPKADGRPAVILDHAGNLCEHGLPDEPRDWSLEDRPTVKFAGPKACPKCFYLNPKHVRECKRPAPPGCDHVFETASQGGGPPREIEEVDGELEKIVDGEELRAALQLALPFSAAPRL